MIRAFFISAFYAFTAMIFVGCVCAEPINLAQGLDVIYATVPDHPKDDEDQTKLTDGKFYKDSSDINTEIVGWTTAGLGSAHKTGLHLVMDLGSEKIINGSTLRFLNNPFPERYESSFRLPREIILMVSKNGQDFYRVKTLKKLASYGKHKLNEYEEYYHVDNPQGTFIHPVEIKFEPVAARYVGVNLVSSYYRLFMDEWQIWGENKNSPDTDIFTDEVYTDKNRQHFGVNGFLAQDDSVYFGPTWGVNLASNMQLPTWLNVMDYRPQGFRQELQYVIEVPGDIELLNTSILSYHKLKHEIITVDSQDYNRYTIDVDETINNTQQIDPGNLPLWAGRLVTAMQWWTPNPKPYSKLGPLYFKTASEYQGRQKARFYCISAGRKFTAVESPIQTYQIPAVSNFNAVPVALSWMWEQHSMDWPDFFNNYKRLGFNTLPAFLMYYWKQPGDGLPSFLKNHLKNARKADLDIVQIDSSMYLPQRYSGETKKKVAEIISCKGEKSSRLCPSYTGEHYQKELERIKKTVSAVKPEYVFLDIELFWGSKAAAEKCPVCIESAEKMGVDIDEYLLRSGTRIIKDISDSIGSANDAVTGQYDVYVGQDPYMSVFKFDRLYPEHIDLSQHSLYIGGCLDIYHEIAKHETKKLGSKWINAPWITTGTYGEFAPFKIEPMIYELILNGCWINFYDFPDFDSAADYYYLAKALKTLEPYQEILKDGDIVFDYNSDNERLYYTFITDDSVGKSLLLVGNYTSGKEEILNVNMGGNKIRKIKILAGKDKINQYNQVTLLPQEFILMEIER